MSNSDASWESDDSLLFQFDPPTPNPKYNSSMARNTPSPTHKKQQQQYQQSQHQHQQPQHQQQQQQQQWRRKSPEDKDVYNSNLLSTPRQNQGTGSAGSSASSWNQHKIPLGESYGSYTSYDGNGNLLGFSPFQTFAHSPPERGSRRDGRGEGKGGYGQSPAFSHSPPERGGKGKSGHASLGSTPNQRYSSTQQSPPKPIHSGGKGKAPRDTAPTTPSNPSPTNNTTAPGTSPKTRSPGSSVKSPPSSNTSNANYNYNNSYNNPLVPNNNYSTNNNYNNSSSHYMKSPRTQPNTPYIPPSPAVSTSTPTAMQKSASYGSTPRVRNNNNSNYYNNNNNNNYNNNYNNKYQPTQPQQMYQQKPVPMEGEGEGFMLFPTDEEMLGSTPSASEPLPDPDNPHNLRSQTSRNTEGLRMMTFMEYTTTNANATQEGMPKNNLLPNILDNT